MIVMWGDPSDSAFQLVLAALRARRAEIANIDPAALAGLRYDLTFHPAPRGRMAVGGEWFDVASVRGLYLRPSASPSAPGEAASALLALASTMPDPVINRPAAGRSNGSKPYQLGAIAAAGFEVPDTLVTTDPDTARAFLREHGRLIYKSISGIRSIVTALETTEENALEGVRSGPVQLQAHVPGVDIRVHTVGDRWFACAVLSDAIDYRYAGEVSNEPPELKAYPLPRQVGERLVALARTMGLLVAGIDLRLTHDGRWVCFEVNPCPGFSWYEEATGHPIAESMAELLLEDRRHRQRETTSQPSRSSPAHIPAAVVLPE